MNKLHRTRRQFVFTTTLLASLSVLLLGIVLYEANVISFTNDISSEDLASAVEDYPEVQTYLETEHQNEAHFLTIANIIKNDQQTRLGNTMLLLTVPILLVASVLGYLAAKRLMKPVEEAYDAQERFIADAAHELRNPLATMSAVVQNTATKKSLASYKNAIEQIKRQIKRMVRINEDLLFLERDQSASVDAYNISELLLDVIEDMHEQAKRRNLTIKTEIDEAVMSTIPAKDFVRVARNLLENAIKYSKPSSKFVSIRLHQKKSGAELTVSDNGIGIPKDDIDHISERFFRSSNAQKQDGSGLGLAIVTKIVEQRQGQLHIESVENKGTSVSVTI